MPDIKLSEHSFYKGKFISPMNDVNLTMTQMSGFKRDCLNILCYFVPTNMRDE